MNAIRPVSDLQDCLEDISKTVHESGQPVFLTKDGYGDMVLMSMEAFAHFQIENEIYAKLHEAELQARESTKRYTSEEILKEIGQLTAV
ncbi:MAG: type II toxin-antitoxin system Phd/YefM family antitoxin [Fibrobacter sp.]|jgi:PHD/YefM family antitoxin component YafN of YafNO toxin-antitoxin module|nr:type II toxin-antitoxin system Phd/YefM family antitoxin [Fibrobacter sp.]MBR4348684.1 type II toxin-antitoxin system Phd/YefM family antitoxin [Fibrobacter sp.]